MYGNATRLISGDPLPEGEAVQLLQSVGFTDCRQADERLREMCTDVAARDAFAECLPLLLLALSETAVPDTSLINFERFVQSVPDRTALFRYLAANPRAVEILVKLFVGSQFLTEILLRNPDYLEQLTRHKRLAEFKTREQIVSEARTLWKEAEDVGQRLDTLRRYQHGELLRIGACDAFGLFDLKSVTVQLSLLADSVVQCTLALWQQELNLSDKGFVVLAMGKLGGEELNYSSDIDLVFLAEHDATRFWGLGQRLIKSLTKSTKEGFLYRVDMRLRPWGRSGSLVNSVKAHLDYLKQHGLPWEKQALLKARPIAGDVSVGRSFLQQVEPIIYGIPPQQVLHSIRELKERIEAGLQRQGRQWGEVKLGTGSIRDVEFVTQFLQLVHGGVHPEVRSINTLDALIRLADCGLLEGDEYRKLSGGYVFLRTIEHSLQLMHYKQTHQLPNSERELSYLARRLDFPDAEQFKSHYERHCRAVREIYDKYLGDGEQPKIPRVDSSGVQRVDHRAYMEASYSEVFSEDEIERHAAILNQLSADNLAEVDAVPRDDGTWQVTVVGYDIRGDLSMICGLLFVYGFNILDGQVFTAEQVAAEHDRRLGPAATASTKRGTELREFVDVFTVQPPLEVVLPGVWTRYQQDLIELLRLMRAGNQREAQGQLAKRVAGALRDVPETEAALSPVEVDIDNGPAPRYTVLEIRAEDTIGFLYELTNALTLADIDISRVVIRSVGRHVSDVLHVTDADGGKITDPQKERELRAAVVLIKHFTHLLPRSPNPEAALLHFRDFLEHLFQQENWPEELASVERPDVLEALARLLGVSDFLWEDFLRLQHENLFPVIRDIDALAHDKSRQALEAELQAELADADSLEQRRAVLNAFKDREMFRADMRHIAGFTTEFGQFSQELTTLAEVVVAGAYRICDAVLRTRYGEPRFVEGRGLTVQGPETSDAKRRVSSSPSTLDPQPSARNCPLAICALGKFGGRELGFASDVELIFVYEGDGRTTGPETITTAEYFQRLVEAFMQSIRAKREGIFQIDLRLRPYGRAGRLAVSWEAFRDYFGPEGAAWPYERQALVKLRPVAGDQSFGDRLLLLRDELIYTGEAFDPAAMRAMREKQIRQLVRAGTINAKLSPGGLVDVEYLVQGLQMLHGHRHEALRTTNTLEAIDALHAAGILCAKDQGKLHDAYVFLRRLIDALRMVRGHAKDLTVPPSDSEEFEFLSRRLGYDGRLNQLVEDLGRHTRQVQELNRLLNQGGSWEWGVGNA